MGVRIACCPTLVCDGGVPVPWISPNIIEHGVEEVKYIYLGVLLCAFYIPQYRSGRRETGSPVGLEQVSILGFQRSWKEV